LREVPVVDAPPDALPEDPELLAVVRAWPMLTPPIRAAILALVHTARAAVVGSD
jgi:hypothetical protein